jgi:hypothetical protein
MQLSTTGLQSHMDKITMSCLINSMLRHLWLNNLLEGSHWCVAEPQVLTKADTLGRGLSLQANNMHRTGCRCKFLLLLLFPLNLCSFSGTGCAHPCEP